VLLAQESAPVQSFNIDQAVNAALRNYPSIQVSDEQRNAAAARIRLARTAYLPQVDVAMQLNRATRNNLLGLLLPQSVFPSISGPVLDTDNLDTAWGSAAGVLVSWEPFDFGLRSASVAAAVSAEKQAQAAMERTRFNVASATAEACVTLVAAEETTRAAQAGVDRSEILTRIVAGLVKAELRPGADASRAEAELAAARTQLIHSQEAIAISQAMIAQYVGSAPERIAIDASRLLQAPPFKDSPSSFDARKNPAAIEQALTIQQAEAQLKTWERSYFPRFSVQGAAYARGSGAQTDGRILGGLNGLGPNMQNYALGLSVTFAIFDFASIHAREAQQSALLRAESARYRQLAADLKAQWNKAVASLDASRRIAVNTPVEVKAARQTLQQATARYESGLGNLVDVAEAQRLATQAEIDDSLARLSVWRSLLSIAVAAGDLQPFLAETSP
jgi:outer membrane protein TolC